jgi:hypothetical protein
MCSIMRGAKSGMAVTSGMFCAIANWDALTRVQTKTTPTVKGFEVLMMLDAMNVLEHEFMMLSLQTRPQQKLRLLDTGRGERAARRLNEWDRHQF